MIELYRNVIDSLDEAIIVLDDGLNVVVFNQAAQRILGLSGERATVWSL